MYSGAGGGVTEGGPQPRRAAAPAFTPTTIDYELLQYAKALLWLWKRAEHFSLSAVSSFLCIRLYLRHPPSTDVTAPTPSNPLPATQLFPREMKCLNIRRRSSFSRIRHRDTLTLRAKFMVYESLWTFSCPATSFVSPSYKVVITRVRAFK